MTQPAEPAPAGTHHNSGVVNRLSPLPVGAFIDQNGEAARVLFGSPLAGTP
jgi:hypothetical protein